MTIAHYLSRVFRRGGDRFGGAPPAAVLLQPASLRDEEPGLKEAVTRPGALTVDRVTQACLARPTRVAKVIRLLHMQAVEDFLQGNVTVIHLVRDPRAIAVSRELSHGPPHTRTRTTSAHNVQHAFGCSTQRVRCDVRTLGALPKGCRGVQGRVRCVD